ncbi:uncharacterized protein METZ01_LOCUS201122 [marine metagenome]|uniref:Phytanoyl-CoA dioxygenase family protein n=1 Tax=marine metagenome TaxID=408172 RepID=A0A382EC56_9ZZZZ
MFSVPLGIVDGYFTKHNELKKFMYDVVDRYQPDHRWEFGGGGIENYFNPPGYLDDDPTLYDSLFLIDEPILKEFNAWCVEQIDFFVSNTLEYLNPKGGMILDCWGNRCTEEGAYVVPHIHTNCIVSATYNLNFDPAQHACLEFINPLNQGGTAPMIEMASVENNQFNALNLTTRAKEGDFLMWPSYLKHGYGASQIHEPYKNNIDRFTLAMNYMPKQVTSSRYAFKVSPPDPDAIRWEEGAAYLEDDYERHKKASTGHPIRPGELPR